MRSNLEKNVDSIITNFKRLYEEADKARQIVTKKLMNVEERERKLKIHRNVSEDEESEDLNVSIRKVSTAEQVLQTA